VSTPERADDGGDALVVAIDGPSGSGKSSVSREVARRLGVLPSNVTHRPKPTLIN